MNFLKACRRERTERVPVWFMRQAGRYMQEYRDIRAKHTLMEIARDPKLACEVTLQPVRAHGVDAAILFSDLLIGLPGMGVPFEFEKGEGPRIHTPVRTGADVAKLKELDVEKELDYTLEAIRAVRRELPDDVPLIGFAGAPFTLASYVIEGGHSRNFTHVKRLMYEDPQAFEALLQMFARASGNLLKAQIAAGAQAVQLFDSWIGALSPEDYKARVLGPTKTVFEVLGDAGVPTIHFGTGTATLLELQAEAGGDVIGVDWRTPVDAAFERLPGKAIQGNLDPVALLGPWREVELRVRSILERVGDKDGYIFNLGHGILPETDPDVVTKVAALVHSWKEN